MPVQIITDSACDLPQDEAKRLGVQVIPLTTCFGMDVYRDGVDLTNHQFFEKLEASKELPTTSQATPTEYASYFKRAIDAGNEVLCITLSSCFSGCYQNAVSAQGCFGDKVYVLDSQAICVEQMMVVKQAVRMRDEGMNARDIAQGLRRLKPRLRLFTVLDTLEYLRKGGRVSSLAAAAGSVLSIKPLITETGGNVKVIGKSRGMKNGAKALAKEVAKCGGIDFDMPYTFAYSGTSRENLDKFLDSHPEVFDGKFREDPPAYCVGSIIGTHVGSNAFAVAFYAKQ